MKNKDQIKSEIKKLEKRIETIWTGDGYNKNDRIEEVIIRIKALRWVLKKNTPSKNNHKLITKSKKNETIARKNSNL